MQINKGGFSTPAQLLQEEIQQQEQKNSNRIDRKLRQKIKEKQQARGLKMG